MRRENNQPRRAGARRGPRRPSLTGLLGPDLTGARQSLVALAISSVTATGAGVALAGMTDTLERLPGLLVLVPAAIGMRGNIFGALGSRLSTTIHAGTFSLSRRTDTVVGQNVVAALILTLVTGALLGLLAKSVALAFGLAGTISAADLIVVSFVGAVLASAVVLVVTLGLAAGSARFGWDLDNVNAPLVSAVGDIVTLPALFAASGLVSVALVTPMLALVALGSSVVAAVLGLRSPAINLGLILRESLPILIMSGVLLAIAGVVIEHRLADFAEYPALLVLVPASLAGAGAVGGILSGRLSSKLHLGVVEPKAFPDKGARRDIQMGAVIAVPVFILNGLLAQLAASVWSFGSPGFVRLIAVSMTGGMLATLFAAAIAYCGTVLAVRVGVDPDTYGIPLVTSTVDLVGAVVLVMSISWIGLP